MVRNSLWSLAFHRLNIPERRGGRLENQPLPRKTRRLYGVLQEPHSIFYSAIGTEMRNRICIVGMPKTGTTAIYQSIRNAMPSNTSAIFEPKSADELKFLSSKECSLTKIMMGKLTASEYAPSLFDKNIVVLRDPRDTLVSRVLYKFNGTKILDDEVRKANVLSVFRQKEADPDSVSLVDIFSLFGKGEPYRFYKAFCDLLLKTITTCETHSRSIHAVRYEDFVDGNLSGLNAYLGFPIDKNINLPSWTKKIRRKGTYGDWVNWFTASDIPFFYGSMALYMKTFGYDDWSSQTVHKTISAEHASEYIERLHTAMRHDPISSLEGLDTKSPVYLANLISAAHDGKLVAIMRLARAYELGEGVERNVEEARQLRSRASEMRNATRLVPFSEESDDNYSPTGLDQAFPGDGGLDGLKG